LRHAAAAALTARRGAATATEEYARRNYADNTSEYNTVIGSLVAQRRQGNVGLWFAASRCSLAVRRIAKRGAFSLICLGLVSVPSLLLCCACKRVLAHSIVHSGLVLWN
jgi:hypothetical protein